MIGAQQGPPVKPESAQDRIIHVGQPETILHEGHKLATFDLADLAVMKRQLGPITILRQSPILPARHNRFPALMPGTGCESKTDLVVPGQLKEAHYLARLPRANPVPFQDVKFSVRGEKRLNFVYKRVKGRRFSFPGRFVVARAFHVVVTDRTRSRTSSSTFWISAADLGQTALSHSVR